MVKRKDETVEGPKKEVVTIVVHKGNREVEANIIKTYALTVLMRFVGRVCDAPVMEDDNTLLITLPAKGDDPGWVQNNILRYVDILGATTDAQVDAKVDRLMARFEGLPDASPEKVGAGIVIDYLNRFYLMQKSASVFRREI
jgi:hypothetical protein